MYIRFFTIEVWFMGMNKQIAYINGLQQNFDLRRKSFPLLQASVARK